MLTVLEKLVTASESSVTVDQCKYNPVHFVHSTDHMMGLSLDKQKAKVSRFILFNLLKYI